MTYFFTPLTGLIKRKSALKAWSVKCVQLYADQFVLHDDLSGKTQGLNSMSVLFTDVCMIELCAGKKNGGRLNLHLHPRMDIHNHGSMVCALLAESAGDAFQWVMAFVVHVLKAYTSQAYAMQLENDLIPNHYIFLPGMSRVVFLFKSPTLYSQNDFAILSKALFNDDKELNDNQISASVWEWLPTIFAGPGSTDSASSGKRSRPSSVAASFIRQSATRSNRMQYLVYNPSESAEKERHVCFKSYLQPIPNRFIGMNSFVVNEEHSQFIVPPTDLNSTYSFMRHLLDLFYYVSFKSNKYLEGEDDGELSCGAEEKSWLEQLGIENPNSDVFLRIIYRHGHSSDLSKTARDISITFMEKKIHSRSLYYSFVLDPYAFPPFIGKTKVLEGRRSSMILPQKSTSPKTSTKRLSDNDSHFSVKSLLRFFSHVGHSLGNPLQAFILAETEDKDSYPWTRKVLSFSNDSEFLGFFVHAMLLTYAYNDFVDYLIPEKAKILEIIGSDEDINGNWEALDCNLGDYFIALERKLQKQEIELDIETMTGDISELDAYYFRPYVRKYYSSLISGNIGRLPEEYSPDNQYDSDLEDPSCTAPSSVSVAQDDVSSPLTVKGSRSVSFSSVVSPTAQPVINLSRTIASKPSFATRVSRAESDFTRTRKSSVNTTVSAKRFQSLSHNHANKLCMYEDCKRIAADHKRFCIGHCMLAHSVFEKRPILSYDETYDNISAVVNFLRNSDDFLGEIVDFALKSNLDRFFLIYPALVIALLTRQPRHICLNLGAIPVKNEYFQSIFPISIRRILDPVVAISLRSNQNNLESKTGDILKKIDMQIVHQQTLQSLLSPHNKRTATLTQPAVAVQSASANDPDLAWNSIAIFSSSGRCEICSGASLKFLALLETHQPHGEKQLQVVCQTLLVMLLEPIWKWLLPDVQALMSCSSESFSKKYQTFGAPFRTSFVLKPFLHVLAEADIPLRLSYVKILNEFMITKSSNLDIVVANPDWDIPIWVLFCDIPMEERNGVQSELCDYLIHYVYLVFFHMFSTHSACFDQLGRAIANLIRFGGQSYSALCLSKEVLSSFLNKIKSSISKYALGFVPGSPIWTSFLDLCRFFVNYLFCTPDWGSKSHKIGSFQSNSLKDFSHNVLARHFSTAVKFPDSMQRGNSSSYTVPMNAIFNVHFDLNGNLMDLDLLEKLLSIFKMLGIQKLESEINFLTTPEEREAITAISNVLIFFEDVNKFFVCLSAQRDTGAILDTDLALPKTVEAFLRGDGRTARLETVVSYMNERQGKMK